MYSHMQDAGKQMLSNGTVQKQRDSLLTWVSNQQEAKLLTVHWNGMDGTWFHWNTKEATKGCWSILMIDLSHVILTGWKAQEANKHRYFSWWV